jgi:hypothetical protein
MRGISVLDASSYLLVPNFDRLSNRNTYRGWSRLTTALLYTIRTHLRPIVLPILEVMETGAIETTDTLTLTLLCYAYHSGDHYSFVRYLPQSIQRWSDRGRRRGLGGVMDGWDAWTPDGLACGQC